LHTKLEAFWSPFGLAGHTFSSVSGMEMQNAMQPEEAKEKQRKGNLRSSEQESKK